MAEQKEKKDVRKKKKKTNNDIETSNLEQYILTQHIDKAANYFTSNNDMFNYRTFRQINGDGSQLVNKLRGIDNLDVFYRIKTSALSLMRPKIRIFKVMYDDYTNKEDATPDQGKVVSLKQPCYKEFKFSDNFGQETAATVHDYLSHESTRPTWRNVGLESFSVKQDGETHGIIENNIECSLKLTFKSLKDLQASPPGEPSPEKGGLRYADLITWAPSRIDRETDTYNPKHYEIKVFLGYSAPSQEQLRGLNLSESDVQAISNIEKLNTVISLSLVDYDLSIADDGQVKLRGTYRGRLETTIGTNQVNIFQNTFRLTEGGGLEVSRKVNAKHNISNVYKLQTELGVIQRGLQSPTCKDEKCKARKLLRSLVKYDSFFVEMVKSAYKYGRGINPDTGLAAGSSNTLSVIGDGTKMFTFFKESDNVSLLQAEIKKKVGLYKKDVYKTFVDQLIDGNSVDEKAPGTRLFCIAAGEKVIQESLGIVFDESPSIGISSGAESTVAEGGSPASKESFDGVKIDRCHRVSPIDANIKSEVANEIASSIDAESGAKDKKTEKHKDPARTSVQDHTGKLHKFYYVYLGDIIELACKNAGLGKLDLKSSGVKRNEGYPIFPEETYFPHDAKNSASAYPLKNARLLLGPLEYRDQKGRLKTINLAQFPISFNFFRAWFIKKVIRRRRAQMPLGAFLTSLMNDLVMPALGVGMPKSFRAPSTRSSMVSLTLPGKPSKDAGEERFGCGSSLGLYEEALPQKQILNIDSAEFKEGYYSFIKGTFSSETLVKTSYDYLLLYVTTSKNIIERRGDPVEDIRDGIYHFNIGSDMGLLKNMKFSRNNIPGLAELRSVQAEAEGVDSLEQLKFPYDTNLTLIGTSLFTPGMFYYVNPSLAGLGSVEDAGSLAYKMNLGGYHLIGKIDTTITADKYETKVIGTQTAQGAR